MPKIFIILRINLDEFWGLYHGVNVGAGSFKATAFVQLHHEG
jgi:hypothetical protein